MSEQYRGDYAPELFDEEKKYYLLQAQELSTLTDAELRDMHDISQTALRRFVQAQIGTGSINNGFLIAENTGDTSNNFKITGGDGILDNPGAFFLDGYRCILRGDIDYKDQTNTGLITDDGYTETPLVPLTTPTGPTGTLNALVVNGSNTVAVGSSIISVSTNAGRSWTDSVSFGTLYGVDMADTSTGYAVGLAGFARETVKWRNYLVGTYESIARGLYNDQFLWRQLCNPQYWVVGRRCRHHFEVVHNSVGLACPTYQQQSV